MKQIFLSLLVITLFNISNTNAAEIKMHEKSMLLNSQAVDKVVIQGAEIYIRSSIRPCAHYPGYPDKIYGDVYECYTSRQKLSEYLNDPAPLNMFDQELSDYILKSKAVFMCNTKNSPHLVKYFGKNVYWFSGILFKP